MASREFQGGRTDEASVSNSGEAWQGGSSSRMAGHNAAESPRRRNDESWVEIASQPSSSSLSSIGDEIVTTGLRVHGSYPPRRRRLQQQQHPTYRQQQSMPQSYFVSQSGTSSHEYNDTESEEDNNDNRLGLTGENPGHQAPLHISGRQQTTVPTSSSSRRRQLEKEEEEDYDDDSDDGNATALGRPSTSPVFRPQPNAFSHPPSHLTHRHSTPGAGIGDNQGPQVGSIGGGSNNNNNNHSGSYSRYRSSSYSRGGGNSSGRPNSTSPPYREDNDAALRASLTTLLSCAAAARGLPKRGGESSSVSPGNGVGGGVADPSSGGGVGGGVTTGLQPMGLRLVPEAELMAEDEDEDGASSSPPRQPTPGSEGKGKGKNAAAVPSTAAKASPKPAPSSPSPTRESKSKRAAAGTGQRTAAGRAAKKKRTSADPAGDWASGPGSGSGPATTLINPTLLAWVVSAGVVVLVSVVGFGAGYVIGREVGRQEGGDAAAVAAAWGSSASSAAGEAVAAANTTGSCGRELVRSGTGGTLRRFRWGGMGRGVTA